MSSFEKLGAFYMGRLYDQEQREVRDEVLLYDAKDLTTHAVCVGMTGSGKTGLCVGLLEEAAIDGVPAIAIDPKGDLGNLLLTFPKLRASDFRPWVDEAEAARKGKTPDEYAADRAALWKKGLGQWGQDGERIGRFKEAADVAIYTPGSSAGIPLQVLRSFTAPPEAVRDDADLFQERVNAAVSGLLALVGIKADPVRSREHILLANIMQHAWREGRDLDLAMLIREIQAPPFEQVGVMDLETFYPQKDRLGLSMTLNNLLASPGFASWLEGEPLDIERLLWTPEGKPRIAILSIAHLSDAERMFFVTLVLNEVLAWIRTQPGTSSLRALLYMDEVFGYFPPTANPPSKKPMLTLLKQARAFGLGVVLATQNPVDLDYKGLSNAGTWLLGRLQTERDKARVLEGLEGASSSAGSTFDRGKMEATLAGLDSRVFLMNNVHDDEPALFHTRWVLSYLRGPLTRSQIQTLMKDRVPATDSTAKQRAQAANKAGADAKTATGQPPIVAPDVPVHFLPWRGASDEGLVYRPALVGSARLHFVRVKYKVDSWTDATLIAPLGKGAGAAVWSKSEPWTDGEIDVEDAGSEAARFAKLPKAATQAKSYKAWSKALVDHLYRNRTLDVWSCKALGQISKPGESEGDFRKRLVHAARESRDVKRAKLEKRYAPKLARLQERIRKAQAKVEKEKEQYGQQKLQTAISIGATVLGALLGRKASSVGRGTTALRGAGRAARERGDIVRATENVEALGLKLADLEADFEEALAELRDAADPGNLELECIEVRPRKSDISVSRVALLWMPWRVDADGIATPAYE